jgi:hypothetical protein
VLFEQVKAMDQSDARIFVRGTFLEIREEEESRANALATFPMMVSAKRNTEADIDTSTDEVDSAEEYNRRLMEEIKSLEGRSGETSENAGQSEEHSAAATAAPTYPVVREQVDAIDPSETRTTLMMKNFPCEFHRDALVELLNRKGFSGQFDLVYLPRDFKTGFALGYGFVNFVSSIHAQNFFATFDGFKAWGVPTKKVARLVWSELQGLAANVEKCRNSNVMHAGVPEHFKPLLFHNGEATPLPSPTCALQSPGGLDFDQNGVSASQTPLQLVGACQAGVLAPSCYTTLLLRNVPNDYNRSMLQNLFNSQGFFGLYNFLYLPVDFERQCSLGYSFVNFVNHISAQQFMLRFSGFCSWGLPTRKVAKVEWAKPQCQGLEAHVARYRGRPIMNSNVPDECKPAIFFHGVRVAFPTGVQGPSNAQAKFS